MSIMAQLLASPFVRVIFFLIGLVALPLLFLVPAALFVLCWEAISDFAPYSWQLTLHSLLIYFVFVVFFVWSGLYAKVNNWFIKKYWIKTRWYVPSDYE